MKVDTSAIKNEIENYRRELRKKYKLIEKIDNLDVEDKRYKRKKNDLDYRLYCMYNKIKILEVQLIEAKVKKKIIDVKKFTSNNIYSFDLF